MAENIRPHAERKGDEPAIVDEFASISWRQLDERVNRLVHGLRGAGLETGDRVALLSGNRHEMFEVVNATAHGGWVNVPVNWHFSPDEVAYVLEDSGAVALVADAEHADLAAEAAARVPGVRLKVMAGGRGGGGFLDYEELLGGAADGEPEGQQSGTTMFYTSGTTGRPKGVISSLIPVGQPASLVGGLLEAFGTLLRFPRDGRTLVMAPTYHSGPFATVVASLALGNTIHLRRSFDPEEMLRLVEELRITGSYAVPTHFVRLLRLPEDVRRRHDLSSLRHVIHTAAPCPPEIKKAMIDWWGPVIYEGYGATEGGFVTFVTSEEYLAKPGTIGKVLPTHEVLVIGEHGERLGPNQVGQLYFRSLFGTDFEYHGAPEKTADAHLEPGVFTFGDVGYVDEDGDVFLSDRKIDMIISGGVNIYPAEIEAVLITHPAVADVAVLGVPNEEYGEEVKAVVEPAPGVEPSAELAAELRHFCRQRIAGYKVPRTIEFEPSLPRTPTGKLAKRELRDRYWHQTGRAI